MWLLEWCWSPACLIQHSSHWNPPCNKHITWLSSLHITHGICLQCDFTWAINRKFWLIYWSNSRKVEQKVAHNFTSMDESGKSWNHQTCIKNRNISVEDIKCKVSHYNVIDGRSSVSILKLQSLGHTVKQVIFISKKFSRLFAKRIWAPFHIMVPIHYHRDRFFGSTGQN